MHDLEFHADPEAIVTYGDWPGPDDWDAHIKHRDEVARAVADHPSNGFQYGVDISSGNVECVWVKPIPGAFPLIVTPDPDTGEVPEGAVQATVCVYSSWR